MGAGEVAWQLRALAALQEDLGSILSTHMAARNLSSVSGDRTPSHQCI